MMITPYAHMRYHLLCELRLTRARVRIGTQAHAPARATRKGLQRELVKLRAIRTTTQKPPAQVCTDRTTEAR